MRLLAGGLCGAKHYTDALSVYEAEFSMLRRLGDSESNLLAVQSNLASLYHTLGRLEDALRTQRDVYSGTLKLYGEEDYNTLRAASNLADSLQCLRRFEEAKGLLRKKMTVARRVLGGSDILFVKMRCIYAAALYKDNGATLDDLREAVAMIEDTDRIARRLLGSAHPVVTTGIDGSLRNARAALRARETPPSPPAV